MTNGLIAVRRAARQSKSVRFTALLHHITIDLLNPREEPRALAAHTGICAGGGEEKSSPYRDHFILLE
jgi:hypothetical protein